MYTELFDGKEGGDFIRKVLFLFLVVKHSCLPGSLDLVRIKRNLD